MVLKTESYKKGIVLSTIFNILNKGLVFVNSLIIAYFFGTQLKTDIYFYAFNTIVIVSAFTTSLNASVLIPESMRLRTVEASGRSMQFLNFFIFWNAILTLLLCVIIFFDPVGLFNLLSDFDPVALNTHRKILLLAAPLLFLMPIVNLLGDILTSYKYFTVPMIAGIINGIFSICFIIIFHKKLDVLSLLAGLLVSYTINLILLIVLMRKKLAWKFEFSRISIEKRIWKNIGFAQAGNITTSLCNYIPLYLLSGFNTGIIAALNYAQQVTAIPTTLITNQFSSVAAIKFNELSAQKDAQSLNQLFLKISEFLVFILMPVSGIVFLYSSEIFSILFNRGAFDYKSVVQSSYFLKYLILLLPMLAINTLVSRLFMAAHLIRQPFWYQVSMNSLLMAFIYAGVQISGIEGYFVALLSVYMLSTVLVYLLLKKLIPYIRYDHLLRKFIVVVFLNAFILLVTFYADRYLLQTATDHIRFIAGSSIYVFLLILFNYLFKINKTFAYDFKRSSFN